MWRRSPWITIVFICLFLGIWGVYGKLSPPDSNLPLDGINRISDKIDSLALIMPTGQAFNVPAFGNTPPKRVVLLGWDGATWKIISKMLAMGEMPNLQRLMEYAAAGVLQTDVAISPISWTTIATGKSREHHGIGANATESYSFSPSEEMKLFDPTLTSDNVAARQIWDMFPIERFPRRAVFSYFLPPSFERFKGLIYREGYLIAPGDVQELCDERDADKDVICLLTNAPYDAAFSIINATDAYGHKFYYDFLLQILKDNNEVELEPAYEEKINAGYEKMMDAYRLVDQSLAPFLNKPDTLVVIVSDHGMQAAQENRNELFLNPSFFNEFGAQIVDYDPHNSFTFDARVGKQSARIAVKPILTSFTIGRWLKYQETLTLDLIAPTFECTSSLGIGCPQAIKEKLDDVLAHFVVQGQPIYGESVRLNRGSVYAPREDSLAALARESTGVKSDGNYYFILSFQGDHSQTTPGIFILAGPGVKPGARFDGATLMDVTPTILALAGLPIAKDFDGNVLTDTIKPAYLAAHPLTSVDTYGTRDISQAKKPILTLEKRRHLRELGYLH